ncbi:MAG: hypothetical protein HYX68_26620 [Planctomycetes bacterium]|nr:hypothetical protein [Planctomycetota bacterium]
MNAIVSSSLLAASMFLGQPGDPPPPRSGPFVQPKQQQQQQTRPILNWFSREDRPILSRIQGWFKRDTKDPQPNGLIGRDKIKRETPPPPLSDPAPAPPASNDFFRKLPNPSSRSTTPGKTVAREATPTQADQDVLKQIADLKNAKTPIRPDLANKIGRDERFEWITGQLEIEKGNHVLYYATPETIDKFDGRIVLMPQKGELTQFRGGDLISVRGQVMQRQTRQGTTAIYRVTDASLIERAKAK